MRAFIKHYGIQYTVLVPGEPREASDKLPQTVNMNSFPTTFFLGRDGRVRSAHAGFPGKASGSFHEEAKREITHTIEQLSAGKELDMARELCVYGQRVAPRLQYPGDPPFEDLAGFAAVSPCDERLFFSASNRLTTLEGFGSALVFLGALPAFLARMARRAAFMIRSESATLEPPNFCTNNGTIATS